MPQELHTDAFETVWATCSFSRGLFGKQAGSGAHREGAEGAVALGQEGRQIITLSGGMKRRVLIAKALSHEPQILFLDEPTAGVDVELRKDMWEIVRALRDSGVTIILTTHYIDEAEEMADRIGVINKGEIILVEEKAELMHKLGRKQLTLAAAEEARRGAAGTRRLRSLTLSDDGTRAHLHLRHAGRADRHHHASCSDLAQRRHPLQRPQTRSKARSRRSSSAW